MHRSIMLLALTLLTAVPASADWEVLPESRYQQYLSFAMFHDIGSALYVAQAGRAWASVGGGIAALEATHWPGSPQLVAFASAESDLRSNPAYFGLLTYTTDARGGVLVNAEPWSGIRLSAGWEHLSGHVSDDIPYPELIGPNLGDDLLFLRVLHDFGDVARVGLTVKPPLGSDPTVRGVWLEQFGEWMPWGAGDERSPVPFLALGFEEHGRDLIQLDSNLVGGVYMGSHFSAKHRSELRFVVGWYSGAEPGLKLDQFKGLRTSFVYSGFGFGF